MIDLPNDLWIRSPRMPDWALCLDPAARFYGWKMYENNGQWVSGHKLTLEEVESVGEYESLREHWPKFEALRAAMGKEPAR